MMKKIVLSWILLAVFLFGCGANDQEAENVSKEINSEETMKEDAANLK